MSDFALLRVAAWPKCVLASLRIKHIAADYFAAEKLVSDIGKTCLSYAEELFRLIPELHDNRKRQALKLKSLLLKDPRHIDTTKLEDGAYYVPHLQPQIEQLTESINQYQQMLDKIVHDFSFAVEAESNALWGIVSTPTFQEALFTWNSAFFDEVTGLTQADARAHVSRRHRDQVELTLYNYLVNATLKTTPHGLWGWVAVSSWGSRTYARMRDSQLTRLVQPNLKHLYATVRRLDLDLFYIPCKINPTLTDVCDDFLYWSWDDNGALTLCRVPKELWLLPLITWFSEPCTPADVLPLIVELTGDAATARGLVSELINHGLLISLGGPAYGLSEPVSELREYYLAHQQPQQTIHALNALSTDLTAVRTASSWSERYQMYQQVQTHLQADRNPLRLDVRAELDNAVISMDINDSAAEAVRHYSDLIAAFYGWKDPLERYKARFRDAFCNASVSLLEVEQTLGHPFTQPSGNFYAGRRLFPRPSHPGGQKNYDRFLHAIAEAIAASNNKELDISRFRSLLQLPETPLPDEVEANYQIDNQNLVCLELLSSQVGRLSWRYSPLLQELERQKLEERIRQSLEKFYKQGCRVAGVIHANGGENDNLAYTSAFLGSEIDVYGFRSSLSEGVINLRDLRLTLKNERFVLHDLQGVQVIPWFSSTLTTRQDTLMVLLDVLSWQGFVKIDGHAKNHFPLSLPYTPRLTWGLGS